MPQRKRKKKKDNRLTRLARELAPNVGIDPSRKRQVEQLAQQIQREARAAGMSPRELVETVVAGGTGEFPVVSAGPAVSPTAAVVGGLLVFMFGAMWMTTQRPRR